MPIPTQSEIIPPFLKFLKDDPKTFSEVMDFLVEHFSITPEERQKKLKSGHKVFRHRTHWALYHLRKTKLVEDVQGGKLVITQSGKNALSDKEFVSGSKVNWAYLRKIPGYRESEQVAISTESVSESDATPEETIESIQKSIQDALRLELLERIKKVSPSFFELIVIDLLVAMGYGGSISEAASALGGTADGGVDGVIREDRLGLDSIYVQAKRWEGSVGRPVVQAFVGSLEGLRAKKGIIITTSDFTQPAIEYVENIEKRVALIDGNELVDLMIEHEIGVTISGTYQIMSMNSEYFEE